ncbi:AMP-binding protein [SAR86 cluster bacterium]|nr:AMP-binding protein [SAR86 cluster bacterium]
MENLYLRYREGFPKDLSTPCIELKDGSIISYKELEDQSSQYANGFSNLGLKPGDRVSVQVNKSPEVLYIYLACLRSNIIFHPLNTAYKDHELSFLLEDADPALFICEKEVYEKIDSLNLKHPPGHIFTIQIQHKDSIQAIKLAGIHEVVDCSEEDTAALLYSSGTTGRPKGIMLTHGNIGTNAMSLKEAWEFTANDCLLHALPIYHVHGLFVALGCVFLSGSKMLWLDNFEVNEVLNQLPKCTVMMGVPTYYTRLINNKGLTSKVTQNLRIFISGSAPLLEETFMDFYSITGHKILERYGMTETNIISSNPISGKRKSGTVGLPLKGQQVRIINNDSEPVGADEIGNIQVKGPNVFKGYWKLAQKSKEDFSLDNYFNTGDQGYFDEDGYLIIVGRNKDMIISGGLNVYPKEIESFIDKIEGVYESAVIGLEDADFGERVVAVIVKDENSKVIEENIISDMKLQMAGYKVPKQIFFSNELPRNAMGKVQKNFLRDKYNQGKT